MNHTTINQEREAFESWASTHKNLLPEAFVSKCPDGRYASSYIEDMWQGWLGKAAHRECQPE